MKNGVTYNRGKGGADINERTGQDFGHIKNRYITERQVSVTRYVRVSVGISVIRNISTSTYKQVTTC